ncbi:hypothetical protein [Shimia sp. NS0008-38b]
MDNRFLNREVRMADNAGVMLESSDAELNLSHKTYDATQRWGAKIHE